MFVYLPPRRRSKSTVVAFELEVEDGPREGQGSSSAARGSRPRDELLGGPFCLQLQLQYVCMVPRLKGLYCQHLLTTVGV